MCGVINLQMMIKTEGEREYHPEAEQMVKRRIYHSDLGHSNI